MTFEPTVCGLSRQLHSEFVGNFNFQFFVYCNRRDLPLQELSCSVWQMLLTNSSHTFQAGSRKGSTKQIEQISQFQQDLALESTVSACICLIPKNRPPQLLLIVPYFPYQCSLHSRHFGGIADLLRRSCTIGLLLK